MKIAVYGVNAEIIVLATQLDLHREFYTARQRAAPPHPVPVLSLPHTTTTDLPGIRQALAATRHLLEMYRRALPDDKTRRRLQRLDRRLLDVAAQLDRITTPKNEERLAGQLPLEVLTWRGLVTYYVLFFIELGARRVCLGGITRHPDAGWMEQVAQRQHAGQRIFERLPLPAARPRPEVLPRVSGDP
jgi:hypothetical protein